MLDLTVPLRWTRAGPDERTLLSDLQANVLKGHGRRHNAYLFLHFDPAAAVHARRFLQALPVTDALSQLVAAEEFRRSGRAGPTIVLCMLSAAGYKALRVGSKAPQDAAFLAGMAARRKLLSDPPRTRWDPHLRAPLHALIILADASASRLQQTKHDMLQRLPRGAVLVAEETGSRIDALRTPGRAIEHFGFLDGRSGPLLLQEDIEREARQNGGTTVWNPAFGLDTVLVRDPAATGTSAFGSFVVFRKLEQDVRAFKASEKALAQSLHLTGNDKKRAGAMIVGRFADGTPIALRDRDGLVDPVPNDFDYALDPSGARCPLHAHIRKMNPRGETARFGDTTVQEERSHLFVRRGVTYGRRARHPQAATVGAADLPNKGVGILFLGYQSSFERQFEFVQARWANSPAFVSPRHVPHGPMTGIDPLIGQGPDGGSAPKAGQAYPLRWGAGAHAGYEKIDFQGYVRMLGGEYFFAPSIGTLKTL